jgi:hypothetical protein
MKVERVRVLKTLKCGEKVFQQGKVLMHPLPAEILKELAAKTETLEVIEEPVIPKKTPKKTVSSSSPRKKLVGRSKKNG